ncbi:DUF4349 domain-containing protein [Microbacterium sp. BWT-B31]|uniref:DUF4349 domain-containing protein n=1 Tax=Microbacterium sp. BWT-B31 TaxID=3232072 RepID=UPI0035286959
MNSQQRAVEASVPLPAISDQRIDEMEDALFADISRGRADLTARRARRGRWWLAGGAAAAVVVVAAVIAPSLTGLVGTQSTGADSAVAPATSPGFAEGGAVAPEFTQDAAGGTADLDVKSAESSPGARDIITTASATVMVDDPAAAAREIGAAAEAGGGWVESMSVGTSGQVLPMYDGSGVAYDSIAPSPYPAEGAWITVRIPSADLAAFTTGLGDVGEVTSSTINRQDITDQTVDLRARIDAAQASVDRLTELMSQAGSLTDLIAAESALSERQALLESYQQMLESLEGQIEMSELSVTLITNTPPVEADPAGFGDGLAAGWNGLVATLNGIVIAIGFLVPWIAVTVAIALIVWGIVRLVRGRRAARKADAAASARSEGQG